WVEPRPTPVLVTALAEGVVQRLLVVEGQEVKAGEPVARLIDADARLALQAAEADLQLREAELTRARAALAAARTTVEPPVPLEPAHAEADALLAAKETELAQAPFQLRAAEARLAVARQNYDSKSKAAGSGAIPDLTLRQAESDL